MKNDFEWGLTVKDDEDYLIHHQVKGGKWGVMHGPPYPLSRTGNYSPEQRRAAKADGRQLPKRNKKAVKAGAVEGSGRKPGSSSTASKSSAGSSSSGEGSKTPEVQLSRKTRKLQKKAANYAKMNHLSNDYNATRLKNASDADFDGDTVVSKDVNQDMEKFTTNLTINKLQAMQLYKMKLDAESSEAKDTKKFLNKLSSADFDGDTVISKSNTGSDDSSIGDRDNAINQARDLANNGLDAARDIRENAYNAVEQQQGSNFKQSQHQDSYDVAHKKPVSMMTDAEIQAANSRLQAEQNLARNRRATASPGQKFLYDAGEHLYNNVIMPTFDATTQYATNKFMSKVTKTDWPPKDYRNNKNNNNKNNNNNNNKNNNNQNNNNQNQNNNNQNSKKKSPMDAN